MKPKAVTQIPERKKNAVKELKDLIKSSKTILIVSIKDIPASQYQIICKKLRGKALVRVPKKNLIFRAIDETKNEELIKLKEQITDSVALLFSEMDSYELAADLLKSKSPSKAKPGQIAPRDIEVEEGPTDMVPGPAVSELGALGIQIKIEKGKIHIAQPKVIAEEGKKISQGAADIMAKLSILPFSIGFIPVAGYDLENNTLYLDIKIDKEKAIEDLKEIFGRALPFAVSIGYFSKETVPFMVQKAGAHERKLIRIINGEPEEEIVETTAEEPVEAPKEEVKEEEKAADAGAGLASLFG